MRDRADPIDFEHLSIDQFLLFASCPTFSPDGRGHVSLRNCPKYDGDIGEMDGKVAGEIKPVSCGGWRDICHTLRFFYGRLRDAWANPSARNGEEVI